MHAWKCSSSWVGKALAGGRRIGIAPFTGPLDVLAGHRALVVADTQNLDSGARDLGYLVSYSKLGQGIATSARQAYLHAVFAVDSGALGRSGYFESRGWIPHAKLRRHVRTHRGIERRWNCDHLVAFVAGRLAARLAPSLILLCSGDGDLVEDIAEGIRLVTRRPLIATLSLAGSTSARLDARASNLISANLELGLDCLTRLNLGGSSNGRCAGRPLPQTGGPLRAATAEIPTGAGESDSTEVLTTAGEDTGGVSEATASILAGDRGSMPGTVLAMR